MNIIHIFLFTSLRLVIKKAIKKTKISFHQLSLRMFLADLWSIVSSVGFVAVPAGLVGLIFLWLGQGNDTLLLVKKQMIDGN